MSDWTDPEQVARQYAEVDNLEARVSLHEAYSTNDTDLHVWVFDHLEIPESGDVLGVGSGPGHLWRRNRDRLGPDVTVVVSDASRAMVTEARSELGDDPGLRFGRFDAARIPFDSDSFDVVVANHMLYHVLERDRAIEEFHRVLRPDGALYATTNGAGHMSELLELVEAATGAEVENASRLFSLENGPDQLTSVFDRVDTVQYPDSLRISEVEPIVEYALSRPEVDGEDVEAIAREAHERMTDGVLEVTKSTGLFVARP